MDIPDTGAVFTLGKSYLSSEDNHSYFFIKNDAVKSLIAGSYQSAVICESGRLFVWGKNDDGQLGIPNNTQLQQQSTVTRPSCVKAYKSNGIKIKSIAFGDKFSVTISLDNRVHICGRNIAIDHSDWKPTEIIEFKTLADEEDLTYIDVQAGNEFFIVLTKCGKAYGYGSNEFNQITKSSDTLITTPEQIAIAEHIKQIVCDDTKSLYATDTNEVYVFNRTVANRIEFDDDIIEYINYNRNNNYLYLICESGSYLSELTAKVKPNDFRKLNLFDETDDGDQEGNQIQMIAFGNDNSLSFTTRSGRFFTNYDRKVRGDEFHEIKKFLSMRIINVSSGAYHILAHALPNLKPLGVINEEMDVRMNVSRSKRSMVPLPILSPVPINGHDENLNDVSDTNQQNEDQIEENNKPSIEIIDSQKDDNANDVRKSAKSQHRSPGKEKIPDKEETEIINTTDIKTEVDQEKEDQIATAMEEQTKMVDNLDATKSITNEHISETKDEPEMKPDDKKVPETKSEENLTKIAIGTADSALAIGTVAVPIISGESEKETQKEPKMEIDMSHETEMDENHNLIPSQIDSHLDVPEKHANEDPASVSETDSVSDISFPGSECTVKFRENPETINSADTNTSVAELENQISEQDLRSINNAVNLVRVKSFAESKLTTSANVALPPVVDTSAIKIIDTKKNEIYNVIQSRDGQLKQIELVQRRSSDEDENKSTNESNDIRFIDNGIDVTDDIKKNEEKKMSAKLLRIKNSKVAPSDQISPVHMEDELLGEKMSIFQMKEVRDSKFETQLKLREQFDSPGSTMQSKPRKPKTPMPIKSRHFGDSENNSDDDDEDDDDADCRTTASAASTKDTKHSSKKHSISNTSLSMTKKQQSPFDTVPDPDLNQNDNKVKKFFRSVKDSSCKKIDNIRSADCMNPACDCMNPVNEERAAAEAANQIQNNQKNSKICNIL